MADFSKIHFLSDPAPFREKEKIYLDVRRREGRVFPDEIVRELPFVSKSNPYVKEWRWRQRSFTRFLSFCRNLSALRGKNVEPTGSDRMTKNGSVVGEDADNVRFRILDLGCGNGWLANRLAENPNWEVWAVDVNEAELAQGARLFGRENLQFAYADILSFPPIMGQFDVIVLAAAVQYFPDLEYLIFCLKKRLKPGGEIHMLDSPFYKNETAQAAARQRTLEYYTKTGVPEMAAYYHHHLWVDVEKLGGKNLNNKLVIKFLQKIKWLAPFSWVVIGNRQS